LSRPDRIAHAFGRVKESQNRTDAGSEEREALEWYKRAYRHYEKTIGKYHHRTADVYHKPAQYIDLTDFDQAHCVIGAVLCTYTYVVESDYIERALKFFQTRGYYEPERARNENLKSMLVRREGDAKAGRIYEEAKSLYGERMVEMNMDPEEADFDDNVACWSR